MLRFSAVLLPATLILVALPASAPAQTTDLDQAIRLLTEARLSFQKVADYECRLIKRERVNGVLLPVNVLSPDYSSSGPG
jgi:hypothetical protein